MNIVRQNPYWNEGDPELGAIHGYRNSIYDIINILSNYIDLQNVDDETIQGFIFDLVQIQSGAMSLSDGLFRGKNTFCEIIKGAIFDLHTVLAAINYTNNNGFNSNVWRQTYDHLDMCKTRLEQALQHIMIDTS